MFCPKRSDSSIERSAKAAVTEGLAPHKDRVHMITYDNRREFTDREGMARDLEPKSYFTHPYASWEHGLNEITNGLI